MSEEKIKPIPEITLKTTGGFTGSTLVIDPETGFLTNPPEDQRTRQIEPGKKGNVFGPLSVFDAKKKTAFLILLKDLFPNYSEACKIVGINKGTFRNHYTVDKVFRECVNEIIEMHVDEIEAKRFDMAKQEKGSFDRMTVLNAYRREIYNPAIKVDVNHSMSREESERRFENLQNVVDAEVIDRVRSLRREQKKLQ